MQYVIVALALLVACVLIGVMVGVSNGAAFT